MSNVQNLLKLSHNYTVVLTKVIRYLWETEYKTDVTTNMIQYILMGNEITGIIRAFRNCRKKSGDERREPFDIFAWSPQIRHCGTVLTYS